MSFIGGGTALILGCSLMVAATQVHASTQGRSILTWPMPPLTVFQPETPLDLPALDLTLPTPNALAKPNGNSEGPKPDQPKIAPAPKLPDAKEPAQIDEKRLVYLASYKSERRAMMGYRELAQISPKLASLKPHLAWIKLPHGEFVRLFAIEAAKGDRIVLCKQLAKALPQCGILWR